MQFNNAPAPLTLRANRLQLTRDGRSSTGSRRTTSRSTPADFAPDALDRRRRATRCAGRGQDDGWFVVQDEASQLVALLAGDRPRPRVLDACASPGGKTTAIAAPMEGRGLLVACDVRDRRIELLRRTVAASGADERPASCRPICSQPLPFAAAFDCVLVDAPCSGLGTLRRDPDIRWRRREARPAGARRRRS